jgi:serine protease DegS
MRAFLKFASWPALAGALLALLILERWVWPPAEGERVSVAGSFRSAVASATPAVVNIYTAKRVATRRSPLLDSPLLSFPRGVPRQRIERSLGSGVIMKEEGYILTNDHVIDGAEAIQVLLSDGRSAAAQVVGRDPATDLAALRIELPDLTAIRLADSDSIAVGDVVLAIGNPLGFGHSVTQGIVSGLGRFGLQPGTYEGFIQTDAVIHPGNSGGALVDVDGSLVGINTLIYTSTGNGNASNVGIGISLAIPSNLAQFVIDDLIRYGQVIRGWLGVSVEQQMVNGSPALLVQATAPGGPAERAGLQAGDLITHLDNEAVNDVRLTMYEVALLRPGERLEMSVLRGGERLELQAVIAAQPEENFSR